MRNAEVVKKTGPHHCKSCRCGEGHYHKERCPEELCPTCGGRLTLCYHKEGQTRIKLIRYPRDRFCASCGEMHPKMFLVPNKEWARVIQPDKRGEHLCKECYAMIKGLIDKVGGAGG